MRYEKKVEGERSGGVGRTSNWEFEISEVKIKVHRHSAELGICDGDAEGAEGSGGRCDPKFVLGDGAKVARKNTG